MVHVTSLQTPQNKVNFKRSFKMNGELVITDCDTSFGKDGSIEKETI